MLVYGMALSRQTACLRRGALALSFFLLVATLLVRPSNYARELVKMARQSQSPLLWDYNQQLQTCPTDYRVRGLAKDPHSGRRTGYVLCLTYREQQTKAALSMYSLQCWAKTLLVNIVEPFLHESRLVVPLDASQKALLAFSDLFSLRHWDGLTTKLGFAPLAPWRQFLSRAPRQMVVVHLRYRTVASGSEKAAVGSYKEGCSQKQNFSEQLTYLTGYGFKVVREVCINFESGQELSLAQFNTHLLGPHHPRDVSIVMNEWRGFSPQENGKRVLINDACWTENSLTPSLYLQPSMRVHCEARNYQQMFLGGTTEYVSVIVRTEKVKQSVGSQQEMHRCLERTVKLLGSVKKKTNINSTFLSMDIGKYGSYSSANNFKTFDYSEFISKIYGRRISISMWEGTFERVSSTHEAGYVALLQKVLVAESRCLVMVGGGSFQKHAIILHKIASKRRGQSPCVRIVSSCSKNMNSDVGNL